MYTLCNAHIFLPSDDFRSRLAFKVVWWGSGSWRMSEVGNTVMLVSARNRESQRAHGSMETLKILRVPHLLYCSGIMR